MTALLEDLSRTRLLDETLIVWKGEFGRTPKINKNAGRDHWGFCQSVLLAGAGVRGGDGLRLLRRGCGLRRGTTRQPRRPGRDGRMIAWAFPLDQEIHDAQGRPYPLCTGKPIEGILPNRESLRNIWLMDHSANLRTYNRKRKTQGRL